jgi:hypothetical protein
MERYDGAGWVVAVLLLVALLAAIAEVGASRSVTSGDAFPEARPCVNRSSSC